MLRICLCLLSTLSLGSAQRVEVRDATRLAMPSEVDSNSPSFWYRGNFHLLNSTGGGPMLSRGADQFSLGQPREVQILRQEMHWPAWIEAVWVDPTGVILAWYHQEQTLVCGPTSTLALPRIGAAASYDGGRTFFDQGIVLSSGDPKNCASQNGYFVGGHGDFTVVLDRESKYFFFYFSNYAGPLETQGVVVARMAFDDRFRPRTAAWKYYNGSWNEPGNGGRATAIFPATVAWQTAEADSFWGPSVHWNTHLEKYVLLMNRSCCGTGWPQEGVYASFNSDLGDPQGWSGPQKLLLDDAFWYPQVLGTGPGETDSIAGERARLYVYGESKWELIFHKETQPESAPGKSLEPNDPREPNAFSGRRRACADSSPGARRAALCDPPSIGMRHFHPPHDIPGRVPPPQR